jgi:hypothetical protein
MVGIALAKSMYAIPTWTRTVRLVREHAALQAALGCEAGVPSEWACYRFATKLRRYGNLLDSCIGRVLATLKAHTPEMGRDVAIDGSDLPAYANGQRYVSKNGPERERFSDPDATWGHRSAVSTRKGGGYYGYKVHARRGHRHRPPGRMDRGDGERGRGELRARAHRHGTLARIRRADGDHGQGL